MWKFTHSIDCPVNRALAWQFWSNIENWTKVDSSLESISLDKPFVAGAKGTTKPAGQPPAEWRLAAVEEGKSATIEIQVPGAVLKFIWTFEDAANGGTTLIQEVTLEGEQAANYLEGVKELERGIPLGMQKLVDAIVKAAASEN